MRFTVLWTPDAEQGLAAIWMDVEDRDAITVAANSIDELLRRDPQSLGESRQDTERVMFIAPLGVDFDVLEEDRIVYVLSAWYYSKKKSSS